MLLHNTAMDLLKIIFHFAKIADQLIAQLHKQVEPLLHLRIVIALRRHTQLNRFNFLINFSAAIPEYLQFFFAVIFRILHHIAQRCKQHFKTALRAHMVLPCLQVLHPLKNLFCISAQLVIGIPVRIRKILQYPLLHPVQQVFAAAALLILAKFNPRFLQVFRAIRMRA